MVGSGTFFNVNPGADAVFTSAFTPQVLRAEMWGEERGSIAPLGASCARKLSSCATGRNSCVTASEIDAATVASL
jgi:hypothetical protein